MRHGAVHDVSAAEPARQAVKRTPSTEIPDRAAAPEMEKNAEALRTPNRTTFLSRRLNHRGTEGTEAEVAPLLRALCASVVLLFGTRSRGNSHPK